MKALSAASDTVPATSSRTALSLASPATLLIGVSLAVAAPSLLLSAMPGADPWAWLVWGRQIMVHHTLDTTQGPSWKPLPVVFTSVFSLFGDHAAPELWLLVARAGGVAALVLAFMLARRLAVGVSPLLAIAAGVIASLGVLLLPDSANLMAYGYSEPLAVALIFGAVLRHLDHRPGQALALGFVVALLRPETWPLVAAYGVVISRKDRSLRLWALIGAVAVLVFWFVPDWIGAGDPLYGLRRATTLGGGGSRGDLGAALNTAAHLVPATFLLLAVWAVVVAVRRRRWVTVVLGVTSLPWVLGVILLVLVGSVGSSRYMIPPAAIVAVLAGVGAAWGLQASRPTVRNVGVVVLVLATVPFVLSRVHDARESATQLRVEAVLERELPDAIRAAGGRDTLLERGVPTVTGWGLATGMNRPLTWYLDVPLKDVHTLTGRSLQPLRHIRRPVVLFEPLHQAPTSDGRQINVRMLGRTPHWSVVAVEPG